MGLDKNLLRMTSLLSADKLQQEPRGILPDPKTLLIHRAQWHP